MIHTDVLIVGGDPAGSACAEWITPQVLIDLQPDFQNYPHGLTKFSPFDISFKGIQFRLPTRQYAVRRIEFDPWLLERSGAELNTHEAKKILHPGGRYVFDGKYSAKFLVGAGGTYCPVYRTFFKPVVSRTPDT